MSIRISYEAKRGCGFRKPGGLYLMGDGPGVPCSALPIPLDVCPTCHAGIKPTRGWTWIAPELLGGPEVFRSHGDVFHQAACPFAEGTRLGPRCGLLWVGEKFYATPDLFTAEANRMGVSRRISTLPKDFEIGTWVLLAHRKAIEDVCPRGGHPRPDGVEFGECDACDGSGRVHYPGVFHAFRPSRIEYVVKGDETQEDLDRMRKRGIEPVQVVPVLEENAQVKAALSEEAVS